MTPRPEPAAPDMVNHPPHYTRGAVECIDGIRAALEEERDPFVAYCRGAAMKYVWRAGQKGDAAEDLRKAAWYCTRAAKHLADHAAAIEAVPADGGRPACVYTWQDRHGVRGRVAQTWERAMEFARLLDQSVPDDAPHIVVRAETVGGAP